MSHQSSLIIIKRREKLNQTRNWLIRFRIRIKSILITELVLMLKMSFCLSQEDLTSLYHHKNTVHAIAWTHLIKIK